MKNTDFENNLKQLAQGFEVSVNQKHFEQIVALRAKKRKRKLLYFVSVFSCLMMLSAAGYFLFNSERVELNNEINKQQLITIDNNNNKQLTKKVLPSKNSQASHTKNLAAEQKINSNKERNKLKVTKPSVVTTEKVTLKSVDEPIGFSIEPINANLSQSTNNIVSYIYAISNFITNNLETKSIRTNMLNRPFFNDSILGLSQSNIALFNPKILDSSLTTLPLKNQHKSSKFGVFADAFYSPVLIAQNAINQNAFSYADSVGLNEDAVDAFAFSLGVTYQLNNHFKIGVGLGIQQTQFEKIRTATFKRDTINPSITSTEKLDINWKAPTADISFTFLSVPLSLTYQNKIGKKTSWYILSGFQYQYLVQNKAYVFYPESEVVGKYQEEKNSSNNRLNQHQLLIEIQPGISYNINNKIAVNLGVSYKQQLLSFYKKSYSNIPTAKYIGLSVGLNYIF